MICDAAAGWDHSMTHNAGRYYSMVHGTGRDDGIVESESPRA